MSEGNHSDEMDEEFDNVLEDSDDSTEENNEKNKKRQRKRGMSIDSTESMSTYNTQNSSCNNDNNNVHENLETNDNKEEIVPTTPTTPKRRGRPPKVKAVTPELVATTARKEVIVNAKVEATQEVETEEFTPLDASNVEKYDFSRQPTGPLWAPRHYNNNEHVPSTSSVPSTSTFSATTFPSNEQIIISSLQSIDTEEVNDLTSTTEYGTSKLSAVAIDDKAKNQPSVSSKKQITTTITSTPTSSMTTTTMSKASTTTKNKPAITATTTSSSRNSIIKHNKEEIDLKNYVMFTYSDIEVPTSNSNVKIGLGQIMKKDGQIILKTMLLPDNNNANNNNNINSNKNKVDNNTVDITNCYYVNAGIVEETYLDNDTIVLKNITIVKEDIVNGTQRFSLPESIRKSLKASEAYQLLSNNGNDNNYNSE